MILAGRLRNGTTFERNGELFKVVEFQHVKSARGAAFVRVKTKNLNTGVIKDETLNPNDKVKRAFIETKNMEYIYNDGELYYFMDPKTYEQIPVDISIVGDNVYYLKENDKLEIEFYENKVIDVIPSNFVELKVTMTEPGVRGDTTSGGSKPATVETGLEVNVPLFIEIGDVLKIDTRTGEYESRVN